MPDSLLQIEELTRRFGGVAAVDRVSFGVEEGEIVGVVGPNGAGKTTLFSLIGGSLRPSGGRIRFQGAEVTGWRPEQAARAGVCRTFQVMRPFGSMTLLENVMVGALLRRYDAARAREEALRCIDLVGLGEKRDTFASGLSTGQRKRLEMARAMATGPRLLLLDEVTGGVDQASIPGLVDLIGRLRSEGVTLVVIEHNMEVIMSVADRIVALHLGRLIADGPPPDVARNETLIEAYLGSAYVQPGRADGHR
jgi:branched-chain amino acid transport system ATP-binding protein